jgi:TonB family protein
MSLATHLWQTTICVGVAALLALALRRSSARTRHTIWLAASLKFLVPLSLFSIAGSYLGSFASSLATPQVSIVVRWLDHSMPWTAGIARPPAALVNLDPFALAGLSALWAAGAVAVAAWRASQWRAASRLARAATLLDRGREAEALRRITRSWTRADRVELRLSDTRVEPGVFGLFRPTLLWPAGLSTRLDEGELEAVLAHEACHVDCGDNLSVWIQMLTETIFWFHPVVWWLGARLVREREHACDEEVVRMGIDKQSYAEGILKVCGFCLRQPAVFGAGVGGANLTERVERIMTRPPAPPPALPVRLLLATIVVVVATAPFADGVLRAQPETMRAEERVLMPAPALPEEVPVPSPLSTRPVEAGQGKPPAKPPVYQAGTRGIVQPKLISESKPNYTPEAMRAGIQGSLALSAVVRPDGTVDDVKVVRSLDTVYGLDDEAVKAIKRWRFAPGTKDRKPVSVRIEVEMSFHLK